MRPIKMEKNFERELPAGYEEVFSFDAKDKKTVIRMNIAAIVISFALLLIPIVWMGIPRSVIEHLLLFLIVMIVSIAAYLVLHELVHGIAYKLLTHEKLTFGITPSVAYCGVPHIYVYRRAALISLLAPFTVFGIIFLLGMILLWGTFAGYLFGVLFAIHFGGCSGDLYDTYLYLTRFKDPMTLMQDTGPKQTFYLPEPEND